MFSCQDDMKVAHYDNVYSSATPTKQTRASLQQRPTTTEVRPPQRRQHKSQALLKTPVVQDQEMNI